MPAGPRPIPPTRFLRVSFEGRFDQAPWANVMWFFLTGSGTITEATLHDLANSLFGLYTTHFMPNLSNATTLDRCALLLYSDDGELVAFSDPASVVGGVSGAVLPANVACCISWPIATHYRGGHPRTYLSGMPQSSIASNTSFDPVFCAAVASDADAFHTAAEALTPGGGITTVEHGVASFVSAGAWRVPPIFRRILAGAHVDTRIDSQRRRLGRDRA